MIGGMSSKGNCYDNAVLESFYHQLNVERASWKKYRTKQEAEEGRRRPELVGHGGFSSM
jgi:transposase InsO family protein